MREDVEVHCPACHESIPLTVNPAKGSKTWIEECCVCDSPMTVRLLVDDDDEYTVEVEEVADPDAPEDEDDGELRSTAVTCPACWEEVTLTIDLSAGSQTYSEDCSVCCRPMTVRVWVSDDGDEHSVDVEAEGG